MYQGCRLAIVYAPKLAMIVAFAVALASHFRRVLAAGGDRVADSTAIGPVCSRSPSGSRR